MYIEAGTYPTLTAEAYHADPALGHSGAVTLLDECPARFRHGRDTVDEEEGARVLEFGRAFHLLVLQPAEFHARTQVISGDNYRKKLQQELRDAARAEGLIPLLSREIGVLAAMEQSVRRDLDAAKLLTGGTAETSIFWRDTTHGVMRKARLDYLKGETIIDLKTCLSAHELAIGGAAYRDRWFSQDPWYREAAIAAGIKINDFVFVCVEKSPPYLVECYRLVPSALQRGQALNTMALRRFADCTASGIWPKYGSGVRYLNLPGFADFQIEDRLARETISTADAARANGFLAPELIITEGFGS